MCRQTECTRGKATDAVASGVEQRIVVTLVPLVCKQAKEGAGFCSPEQAWCRAGFVNGSCGHCPRTAGRAPKQLLETLGEYSMSSTGDARLAWVIGPAEVLSLLCPCSIPASGGLPERTTASERRVALPPVGLNIECYRFSRSLRMLTRGAAQSPGNGCRHGSGLASSGGVALGTYARKPLLGIRVRGFRLEARERLAPGSVLGLPQSPVWMSDRMQLTGVIRL